MDTFAMDSLTMIISSHGSHLEWIYSNEDKWSSKLPSSLYDMEEHDIRVLLDVIQDLHLGNSKQGKIEFLGCHFQWFGKPLHNEGQYVLLLHPAAGEIDRTDTSGKELEDSKLRVEKALSVSGIGIFEWNIQTGETYTDHRIIELFKNPGDTSQSFWRTVLGEQVIANFSGFDHSQPSIAFEFSHRHEGEVRHYRVVAAPEIIAGEFTNVTGVCMDITELKSTQQALIHTSKLASLGEMSAGIAHEINNPLAIILGSVQILLRTLSQESTEVDMEQLNSQLLRIEKMVKRIAKIVMGLRIFARDSELLDKEEADIRQVVEDSLDLCGERMRVEGIEIRKNLQSQSLFCDRIRISQILINLLNNAHDVLTDRDEKWVEIGDESDQDWIRIYVKDSGRGISDELRDKIMDPFFTTKSANEGTGLGLSLSQSIAKDHGGKLYLDPDSEYTKFVLVLPRLKKHRVAS